MKITSAIIKGTVVGLLAVLAALAVLLVLGVFALAVLLLAAGGRFPVGGDPMTFFMGGGWIDLFIILLLSFVSGFLLTIFRHASSPLSFPKWIRPAGS